MLKRVETVDFDPTNKEHRAAVRSFMKRKAWVDSSIRFSNDPAFSSIVDQVQTKLLQWYMDKEETREAKKHTMPVKESSIRQFPKKVG